MTRYVKHVATCDRCNYQQTFDSPESEYSWGITAYVQWNGPLNTHRSWPTRSEDAKDLCPACMDQLDKWWNKNG